jgi:hypothetical protein
MALAARLSAGVEPRGGGGSASSERRALAEGLAVESEGMGKRVEGS